MTREEFRRNFLVAVVALLVAFVVVRFVLKAALMMAFYVVVAAITIAGAAYLYGRIKRSMRR